MFTLREGNVREEFIRLFGGNDKSEEAVRLGLKWLAERQHAAGEWRLHDLHPKEKNMPKVSGEGGEQADTAATGLALLPFLGAGHTHRAGDYQQTVAGGLKWLVEHQKEDGDLFTGGGGNNHMYAHGIAAIALCEAYGMTRDPELARPAQRAIDFIAAAQHEAGGGWRYKPGQPGDTSVVGWQVMALKSGEMAGLGVPSKTLAGAVRWLDSVEDKSGGRFGYQGRGATAAMSAEALLCRQFLGAQRDDTAMRNGAEFLKQNLPQPGNNGKAGAAASIRPRCAC
jgi:hypothetical protein